MIGNSLESAILDHLFVGAEDIDTPTSISLLLSYAGWETDDPEGPGEALADNVVWKQTTPYSAQTVGTYRWTGRLWDSVMGLVVFGDGIGWASRMFYTVFEETLQGGRDAQISLLPGDVVVRLNSACLGPALATAIIQKYLFKDSAEFSALNSGNVHVGMFLGNPLSTGVEVAAVDYARQPFLPAAHAESMWATTEDIVFGPPTVSWGPVSHLGMFDGPDPGDTLLFAAPLTRPIMCTKGIEVRVGAGLLHVGAF